LLEAGTAVEIIRKAGVLLKRRHAELLWDDASVSIDGNTMLLRHMSFPVVLPSKTGGVILAAVNGTQVQILRSSEAAMDIRHVPCQIIGLSESKLLVLAALHGALVWFCVLEPCVAAVPSSVTLVAFEYKGLQYVSSYLFKKDFPHFAQGKISELGSMRALMVLACNLTLETPPELLGTAGIASGRGCDLICGSGGLGGAGLLDGSIAGGRCEIDFSISISQRLAAPAFSASGEQKRSICDFGNASLIS